MKAFSRLILFPSNFHKFAWTLDENLHLIIRVYFIAYQVFSPENCEIFTWELKPNNRVE